MMSFVHWLWPIGAILLRGAAATPFADLDKAILTDFLTSYDGYPESTCGSGNSATTTSSFDWPGQCSASPWLPSFRSYEEGLFQASMSYTAPSTGDASDRSWTIRIGTGGNMYSHRAPDLHGETMPPQNYESPNTLVGKSAQQAPWIDEVHQMVAVNNNLNGNQNDYGRKAYFHHQAGAYQSDRDYMRQAGQEPFYSPNLARHCEDNWCAFASWGTHAHVQNKWFGNPATESIGTPFTSPVMYITKFSNCGDGVIEVTQLIHNFAPSSAPSASVEQNYFNVAWTGIRTSSLPHALEPNITGVLQFTDPENVDSVSQCFFTNANNPNEQIKDLDQLGGYTAFVSDELRTNAPITTLEMPCRKAAASCAGVLGARTCMVDSCTDTDVNAGYKRLELRIKAGQTNPCRTHANYLYAANGEFYPGIKCKLHDTGFGQNTANLVSYDPCKPWTKMGFRRPDGEILEVLHVKHWNWAGSGDEWTFFAIRNTNQNNAKNEANNFLKNSSSNDWEIEVVHMNPYVVPTGYNPSNDASAFTFVYGQGDDYTNNGNNVGGDSRRRIGSTARDATIHTINWWKTGANVASGQTYINRSFMFASKLGAVETIGNDLNSKVEVDKLNSNEYNPRAVDLYQSGNSFKAVAAATSEGDVTTCGSAASKVCSGTSTPSVGKIPFFYVTCGSETYFGSDPYHFTPGSGEYFTFPGHNDDFRETSKTGYNQPIRSYACRPQGDADIDVNLRPRWKLIGFFDLGCTGLDTLTYDESVCDAPPTSHPTNVPSLKPSQSPSDVPSLKSSQSPSDVSSLKPSQSPSDVPSPKHSQSPSDVPSPKPSQSPSDVPSLKHSQSPSDVPSLKPSQLPSDVSSLKPSQSPSDVPSLKPSQLPSDVASLKPSQSPSDVPSLKPSQSPSNVPSLKTSQSPSDVPSLKPSLKPSQSPSDVPSIKHSPAPSPSPSSSSEPSRSPSNSDGNDDLICIEYNNSKFFSHYSKKKRVDVKLTCKQLRKKTADKIATICSRTKTATDGTKPAKDVCVMTCKTCECGEIDKQRFYISETKFRNCDTLNNKFATNPNQAKKWCDMNEAGLFGDKAVAKDVCPTTCKTCPASE